MSLSYSTILNMMKTMKVEQQHITRSPVVSRMPSLVLDEKDTSLEGELFTKTKKALLIRNIVILYYLVLLRVVFTCLLVSVM